MKNKSKIGAVCERIWVRKQPILGVRRLSRIKSSAKRALLGLTSDGNADRFSAQLSQISRKYLNLKREIFYIKINILTKVLCQKCNSIDINYV